MTIVLIEDEKSVATLLKERFERIGAQVTVCRTWSDAVRCLKNPPHPDIVSLDLILPDSTLSHAEEIQAVRDMSPESFLMVVSGALNAEHEAKRADAFIPKEESMSGSRLYKTIMCHLKGKPCFEQNVALLKKVTEGIA